MRDISVNCHAKCARYERDFTVGEGLATACIGNLVSEFMFSGSSERVHWE